MLGAQLARLQLHPPQVLPPPPPSPPSPDHPHTFPALFCCVLPCHRMLVSADATCSHSPETLEDRLFKLTINR